METNSFIGLRLLAGDPVLDQDTTTGNDYSDQMGARLIIVSADSETVTATDTKNPVTPKPILTMTLESAVADLAYMAAHRQVTKSDALTEALESGDLSGLDVTTRYRLVIRGLTSDEDFAEEYLDLLSRHTNAWKDDCSDLSPKEISSVCCPNCGMLLTAGGECPYECTA